MRLTIDVCVPVCVCFKKLEYAVSTQFSNLCTLVSIYVASLHCYYVACLCVRALLQYV